MLRKSLFIFVVLAVSIMFTACEKVEEQAVKDDVNQNPKIDVVDISDLPQANSFCEDACKNYTSKCMSKIPGASQSLLEQSMDSCLDECANWSDMKAECIKASMSCEEMTDNCGL